ncbi:DUF1361 domain-containing protein [Paenibacillus sp. y28]|uniref:DUF1361 domain-containing protein n=1 Tax=Paenibacillus sp. y28 TaxID=3129110 RepID=UPI003015D61F
MKALHEKKVYLVSGALTLLTCALYVGLRNKTHYDFLVWNLFLAWIPMAAAGLIAPVQSWLKGKLRLLLLASLGGIWLLFYPNSPYIVTDLVHLTLLKTRYSADGQLIFYYWYDFIVIMLFAWTGLLLGFFSTYRLQEWIGGMYGRFVSWCFVLAVSLLAGYGILLGRKYRLNSWEVFTDRQAVLDTIRQTVTMESVLFCLLFGLFIAVVHVTFYVFLHGLRKV